VFFSGFRDIAGFEFLFLNKIYFITNPNNFWFKAKKGLTKLLAAE